MLKAVELGRSRANTQVLFPHSSPSSPSASRLASELLA